jgi:hypothetical protein
MYLKSLCWVYGVQIEDSEDALNFQSYMEWNQQYKEGECFYFH